jgi:hypothetical protein
VRSVGKQTLHESGARRFFYDRRFKNRELSGLWGFFVAAAYNLVRLARLLTFSPAGAS